MSSTEQFLGDAGYESWPGMKFKTIGDGVTGTIAGDPRVVETDSLRTPGTKEPKLVIALTVDKGKGFVGEKVEGRSTEREVRPGETVSVWVGKGLMAQAVATAVKAAGERSLAEGGKLTVRFTGTKDTGQIQPAKVYAASYTAPAPGVDVGGWDTAEEPPF